MRGKFTLTLVTLAMLAGCHGHMVQGTDGEIQEGHSEHHHGNHNGTNHQEQGHHDHGKLEIPQGEAIPTIELIAHADAKQGWNLEIQVENFRFAPEKVNQESNTQEGHAHLYINGKKITRLYGNWFYLGNLSPGENTIAVSLNANGHESFVYDGKAIEDTVVIEVNP